MVLKESFSKGFKTYKNAFAPLQALNAFSFFVMAALVLALFLPVVPLYLGFASQHTAIMAYFIAAAALFVVAIPLFSFSNMAGSVLALDTGRLKAKKALRSIKTNYIKLLINSLIFAAILLFLFVESLLLLFAFPFVGFLVFLFAIYMSIRLSFWDVLLFLGEKHPLRASWSLTQGKFWVAFLFVAATITFMELVSIFPLIGWVFGFLFMPFITTSKAVFVVLLREELNKRRA